MTASFVWSTASFIKGQPSNCHTAACSRPNASLDCMPSVTHLTNVGNFSHKLQRVCIARMYYMQIMKKGMITGCRMRRHRTSNCQRWRPWSASYPSGWSAACAHYWAEILQELRAGLSEPAGRLRLIPLACGTNLASAEGTRPRALPSLGQTCRQRLQYA